MTNYFIPQTEEFGATDYTCSNFPSGEAYVKINPDDITGNEVSIFFRYQGDASLITLFMLTDAIRRAIYDPKIDLYIPYFPGARCDRIEEEQFGEALSVKVYADLINAQGYRSVIVFDPHSNVTPALINNCEVITNLRFANAALKQIHKGQPEGQVILISPDMGASKKVRKVSEYSKLPMIQAEKARDLHTGKLIPGKCVVHATVEQLKDKWAVIIDDICSRGGTFIAIAKKLKEMGVAQVFLIVSHFEHTADMAVLKEAGISYIIATDSRKAIANDQIMTYNFVDYVS